MNWSVYVIEADDGSWYTGITTDVPRRFKQHCDGSGAKFFRSRSPIRIIWQQGGYNRSTASQQEAFIKSLTKPQKRAWLASQQSPNPND